MSILFYYAKDKVKPRIEIKIIGLFLCPASIKIQAKITMAIPVIHSFSLEKNHVNHILAYSLQTNRVMRSEMTVSYSVLDLWLLQF